MKKFMSLLLTLVLVLSCVLPAFAAETDIVLTVANDPASGCYLAELKNGYMLLGIASCTPKLSPHGMTEERIDWIEAQVKAAKAQGQEGYCNDAS